jgi:hypothetical protein
MKMLLGPGPPLVESSCFMRCRRKLRLDGTPTRGSLGGSDEEAVCIDRCGQERLLCRGPSKGRAMTEDSKSNDDNGAGQIAMTDDLFGWPGDGLHWAWQRCGRYEYRKVLMHSTNPDHLVPSAARGSGGFLRVTARYAAGRKRCSTTS